jgi:hypothetical protein
VVDESAASARRSANTSRNPRSKVSASHRAFGIVIGATIIPMDVWIIIARTRRSRKTLAALNPIRHANRNECQKHQQLINSRVSLPAPEDSFVSIRPVRGFRIL